KVAHLPFNNRLNLINTQLIQRFMFFNHYYGNVNADAQSIRPLLIVRKRFYGKDEITQLLGKFIFSKGDRIYYDNERRHHKSDGIIFQPDTSYIFHTDSCLIKWKFHELSTIDLQVNSYGNGISLLASGPDGTQVDCSNRGGQHISFGKFDSYRI